MSSIEITLLTEAGEEDHAQLTVSKGSMSFSQKVVASEMDAVCTQWLNDRFIQLRQTRLNLQMDSQPD